VISKLLAKEIENDFLYFVNSVIEGLIPVNDYHRNLRSKTNFLFEYWGTTLNSKNFW